MIVKENDTVVLIEGNIFKYYFNKRTGLFDKILYDGIDQIVKPMEVNIWRELTDADVNIRKEWYRVKYDKTSVRACNTIVEKKGNAVVIKSMMSLASEAVQKILEMKTVWVIDVKGVISLEMSVKRYPENPILPNFGLRLHLDNKSKMEQHGNCFNCSNVSLKSERKGLMEEGSAQHKLEQKEFDFKLKLIPYKKGE